MGLFLSFCGFCMDKEEPALLLMVLRSGVLDQRQCRNLSLAVKGHPKRKSAGVHQLIVSPIERHSKKAGRYQAENCRTDGRYTTSGIVRQRKKARMGRVGKRS